MAKVLREQSPEPGKAWGITLKRKFGLSINNKINE
jgi:hypothetical protein